MGVLILDFSSNFMAKFRSNPFKYPEYRFFRLATANNDQNQNNDSWQG